MNAAPLIHATTVTMPTLGARCERTEHSTLLCTIRSIENGRVLLTSARSLIHSGGSAADAAAFIERRTCYWSVGRSLVGDRSEPKHCWPISAALGSLLASSRGRHSTVDASTIINASQYVIIYEIVISHKLATKGRGNNPSCLSR